MSESGLIPVEQKTIVFYDDEITAVVIQSGNERIVYVPLRPICDYLGLDWSAQRQRINRDQVLAEAVQGVVIITTPSPDGRGGGPQETVCLPLDYLNGWLFGVSVSRVKPEMRERLITYQRECYRVLAQHFTAVSPASSSSSPSSTLMQVREMGLAIARMAEEQMEFDRRLSGAETAVSSLDGRLQILEAKLAPPEHAVTDEQASQISQAVKLVAIAQGKISGRNEFGATYGEMYRRFGISSYKLAPAVKFKEIMNWLNDWYQRLVNEDLPF
jgi:hypothetical protein